MADDRQVDPDLIRARQIALQVMRERYAKIRIKDDLDGHVITEAEGLRRYLLSTETRAYCILAVSFMEDAMLRAFTHYWRLSKSDANDYFGSNGPLNNFAQRSLVARGIGWFDAPMASTADLLRKIRNKFAHDHKVKTLCDDPVAGYAESLPKLEQQWEEIDAYRAAMSEASRELRLRLRLYCNAMSIVGVMLARAKLINAELPPEFRDGRGFDAHPEVWQALTDITIRHCFRALNLQANWD